MHASQTSELRQATTNFSTAYGEVMSAAVENKSVLLIHWVQYLTSFHLTKIGDQLLLAVGSSIREAAGALSLGLLRQTLFSLRGQIDLLLAWLYFKDHAVEWEHVNLTADGFKLKKELLQYLEANNPRFGARFGLLREIATRKEPDPYRLLSAHIHAQSEPVLPQVINLKDMVVSEAGCIECANVAYEVSEYLNDILLAIHVTNWHSLPTSIRDAAHSRFQSPEQRKAFFT